MNNTPKHLVEKYFHGSYEDFFQYLYDYMTYIKGWPNSKIEDVFYRFNSEDIEVSIWDDVYTIPVDMKIDIEDCKRKLKEDKLRRLEETFKTFMEELDKINIEIQQLKLELEK